MFNTELNWNKINQIAEHNQSTAAAGEKKFERSIFAKFPAGMHKLRIIPIGNRLEGLPFVEMGQHSFRLPDDKGQLRTQFVMCWSYLMNNLNGFESVEDKRSKSMLSYLIGSKKPDGSPKLDPINQQLYEQHGCPVCKAYIDMERCGVDKNVRNNFFMKEQWIWNVVWRPNGFSGDNKIYVWGVSKKHFNHIINVLQQDKKAGVFTLDPNNGYDHSWNATGGNDFSRRYDAPMFERVPTPLHLTPDQIPFDLIEVASNSFKPYQDVVNLLKRAASELLANIGHTIAGDVSASIPMQYQNPSAMQVPQQNNVVQFPQPVAQPPQAFQSAPPQVFAPQQVNQPWAMPGTPIQTVNEVIVSTPQPEKKDLGNGYYQIGANVYKPDGSLAF